MESPLDSRVGTGPKKVLEQMKDAGMEETLSTQDKDGRVKTRRLHTVRWVMHSQEVSSWTALALDWISIWKR